LTVVSLSVRFIRSTWPLVQGWRLGEAMLDAVLAADTVEMCNL
jgi:hypothetical protein